MANHQQRQTQESTRPTDQHLTDEERKRWIALQHCIESLMEQEARKQEKLQEAQRQRWTPY